MLNLKVSYYLTILIKELKLIKVLAIINKNPNEIGKKIFQPNLIN
jgi:hypothetical protein